MNRRTKNKMYHTFGWRVCPSSAPDGCTFSGAWIWNLHIFAVHVSQMRTCFDAAPSKSVVWPKELTQGAFMLPLLLDCWKHCSGNLKQSVFWQSKSISWSCWQQPWRWNIKWSVISYCAASDVCSVRDVMESASSEKATSLSRNMSSSKNVKILATDLLGWIC